MPTLVTTGQITIVDNNDARPITAFVTASGGTQQVYTKDESTTSYTPDYTSANNTLTAKVYVGGTSAATEVASLLTNRKWSNDLSASIGSATTLVVSTNLTEGTPSKVYYFEGDYTDPVTGLVSHIIAQITLAMVKTGTNAVYVLTRGKSVIEQATGTTKNCAVICADLIRAAGIDTSGVTYQFYKANGATQVDNTMTTLFGLKTTAGGAGPTGIASEIGTNLPANGAWSAYNTLVIHESAISEMDVYRVVVKDADAVSYQAYFTIYDITDPYDLSIISSAGDKLQNGVGSTYLTPVVYYGATLVADLTSWSFKWYYYDKDGNRCGFVDTTRTAQAGGRTISANTAGAGSAVTYGGASITVAAGDMVKIVDTAGVARYFEVASGTTNVVTLRAAITSTFLNTPWPTSSITLNQFAGGKLYICTGTGATAGTQTTTTATTTNARIPLTGDEVDAKGTVVCEVTRP